MIVKLSTPNGDISPESRVIPTEDMNTVQYRISGEKLPEIILELCDYTPMALNANLAL